MRSPSLSAGKLNAKDICALALMGALMFALKMALVALPNVNMNALIIILTAVFFGWRVLYSVAVYIMLEGLVFGFGMWWFCYWYLWPILAIAANTSRTATAMIFFVFADIKNPLLSFFTGNRTKKKREGRRKPAHAYNLTG